MKSNYLDGGMVALRGYGRMNHRALGIPAYVTPTVAVTGTFLTTPTEAEVVTGGQTIILTMTNGTWPATLSTAMKQAIIDALDSAQSEAAGWDAEVRDKAATSTVVRTSATVVTVTLPATAGYSITADEVVTVTVPRTVTNGGVKIRPVATITIDAA